MPNTPEPADQPKISAVVSNGQVSSGNQATIDAIVGGTTYTVVNSVNFVLNGAFIELRGGVPYQFTASQAAAYIAAGVPLVGPA